MLAAPLDVMGESGEISPDSMKSFGVTSPFVASEISRRSERLGSRSPLRTREIVDAGLPIFAANRAGERPSRSR